MEIDKGDLLRRLRDAGKNEAAHKADHELPDTVDTQQHQAVLDRVGIDLRDVNAKPGT